MSPMVPLVFRSTDCHNVAELNVWWHRRLNDLRDALKAEQDGSAREERARMAEWNRRQKEMWGFNF